MISIVDHLVKIMNISTETDLMIKKLFVTALTF